MKDIVIIGAGGLGRDVIWLVERINEMSPEWNIQGFVDDDSSLKGEDINGYPVLGTLEWLKNYKQKLFVVCTIANPIIRRKIVKELSCNDNVEFASLIDPTVVVSNFVEIGRGCIICAYSIATVNVKIGNHVIVNMNCTIGHDAIIRDFSVLYPSVNVSGNVLIGEGVEVGTGAQIIQGIDIGRNIIIGAGAVVVKNIIEEGTYIGLPARRIK